MNYSHPQPKSFSSPLRFTESWASLTWNITDHLHTYPSNNCPGQSQVLTGLDLVAHPWTRPDFKGDGIVSIDFRVRTWLIPSRFYARYAVESEWNRSWDSFPFHLRLWQLKIIDSEGMDEAIALASLVLQFDQLRVHSPIPVHRSTPCLWFRSMSDSEVLLKKPHLTKQGERVYSKVHVYLAVLFHWEAVGVSPWVCECSWSWSLCAPVYV